MKHCPNAYISVHNWKQHKMTAFCFEIKELYANAKMILNEIILQ